ncbi:MAG: diiron oxygenase [Cytophagales bacterium]|nr:diiron oxygenase [Cytophagales bacterium]
MEPAQFEETVERMIQISKEKPLLPEEFVPWDDEPTSDTLFMPDGLVSLQGHERWDDLTKEQQIELGKLEMVQVMYSYAWSETLACQFFNRHLLTLNPNSVEYRFLVRETIEEYRHQEMFGMAVRKLDRVPELPTGLHKLFGNLVTRWFPSSLVFMSVLSVELMADIYAKHIRKDERVFSVLRKTSELHHIEEGRHIFYTKLWLDKYTKNANFIMRSTYSLIIMLNVFFMRTLYVRRSFFVQLGLKEPDKYFKIARANFTKKFPDFAMDEAVSFVDSFKGFNFFTKPLWKWILKVNV